MLAVVGTRNATDYGRRMCDNVLSELSGIDMGVVSGLAYSIDTYAHRMSLDYSIPTYAVLGSGFDNVYPASNIPLAEEISDVGCLITEFTHDTKPDRDNFPRRNRIIAGLSDAVLVVEAAQKGGALITADMAISYDREVFAVPGRATDKYSEGCNNIIKNNKAYCVTSANDIIVNMNWDCEQSVKMQKIPTLNLEGRQREIYSLLSQKDRNIDDMATALNMSVATLSVELMEMEINGIVEFKPGKLYGVK